MVHRDREVAVRRERLREPREVRGVAAAAVREQHDRKTTWGFAQRRVPGPVADEDAVPLDLVLDGAGRRGIPDRGRELAGALLVDEDAARDADGGTVARPRRDGRDAAGARARDGSADTATAERAERHHGRDESHAAQRSPTRRPSARHRRAGMSSRRRAQIRERSHDLF